MFPNGERTHNANNPRHHLVVEARVVRSSGESLETTAAELWVSENSHFWKVEACNLIFFR